MKVVFLDIDGVLNQSNYRKEMIKKGHLSVILQREHLTLLKKVVDATDASIVLISSWRKFWRCEGSVDSAGQQIEQALDEYGLFIIDKTPVLHEGSRSDEVEQWLKNKHYVEQYVILDDNDFLWSRKLQPHWVWCPAVTGFTDQLADVAINVLNGYLISRERIRPVSLLSKMKKCGEWLKCQFK